MKRGAEELNPPAKRLRKETTESVRANPIYVRFLGILQNSFNYFFARRAHATPLFLRNEVEALPTDLALQNLTDALALPNPTTQEQNLQASKVWQLDDMPGDVLFEIMSCLPVENIGRLAQVNKGFQALTAENTVWRRVALNYGIPLFRVPYDGYNSYAVKGQKLSPKEEVKLAFQECEYPPEFIELLGSKEALDALPLLRYKAAIVPPWESAFSVADFRGNKIMRGIGIDNRSTSENSYSNHYPFIAFCVKKSRPTEDGNIKTVGDLFIFRKDKKYSWLHEQSEKTGEGAPDNRLLPYFKMLMNNQKVRRYKYELGNHVHDGGERTLVQLTDQTDLNLEEEPSTPRVPF